jgi:phosphatidylglycerophosphate synthase
MFYAAVVELLLLPPVTSASQLSTTGLRTVVVFCVVSYPSSLLSKIGLPQLSSFFFAILLVSQPLSPSTPPTQYSQELKSRISNAVFSCEKHIMRIIQIVINASEVRGNRSRRRLVTTNMTEAGLRTAIFHLLNSIVEIYLANIIKPFLVLHEKFYNALNTTLRTVLDNHSSQIPKWFTANFITYARTCLVIPCIYLINKGHTVIPSLIIFGVDFGDFLDGVVARFWIDQKEIESIAQDADAEGKDKPNIQESWVSAQRKKNYGGFIDAICDKVFVVPCWICLLATVPVSGHVSILQYIVLLVLILTESASGSIRFKAYYSSNGVTTPTIKGLDFSSSAVKVSALTAFFSNYVQRFTISHTRNHHRLITLEKLSKRLRCLELHSLF